LVLPLTMKKQFGNGWSGLPPPFEGKTFSSPIAPFKGFWSAPLPLGRTPHTLGEQWLR
jgi:hypothetical protein